MTTLIPRERREIASGAVLVPDWLSHDRQREIVKACREWARGPVPIRHTRLPSGGVMSVQTVCLGWHWQPVPISRTAENAGGGRVMPLPDWLADVGRCGLNSAYRDRDAAHRYHPDVALINFYNKHAKLGMHQDKDERSDAPIVSLSIGDSCICRFGNTANRGRSYVDVELRSGDLLVFGGPSRYAYHRVPKILPGTGDPSVGLPRGRPNLTLRVTGLAS